MSRRALLTAAIALAAPAAAADPPEAAFAKAVGPFLEQHCNRCHGPQKAQGGLTLHDLKPVFTGPDAERWREVVRRVRDGDMPPKKEPRPKPDQLAQVVARIDHALGAAGGSADGGLPEAGNRVPHDDLFDPENAGRLASTPARYWRVSPTIYNEFRKARCRTALPAPLTLPNRKGFRDYAADHLVDEPTIGLLWNNAEQIIDGAITGKAVANKRELSREVRALLDPKQPLTDDVSGKAVAAHFRWVLDRPPTADELTHWTGVLGKSVGAAGREVGARNVLVALVLHPEALYRKEVGEGKALPDGRRMLSPRELVYAVQYALHDPPPSAGLHQTAAAGNLTTREDVGRTFDALYGRGDTARVHRFFQEFFEYQRAVEVFKTNPQPGYHPTSHVHDTALLIRDVVLEDRDVLARLLTTPKSYVSFRYVHPQHLPHLTYGLPAKPKDEAVELPAGQRAGVLTQPSWLLAFSTNFDNHAIGRGHWVRERLLGYAMPNLPIDVDAQLPDDKAKTLRQRMEVTRRDSCWACHQRMDPLGLPFEAFDHFGKFRTAEVVLDPPPPGANKPRPVPQAVPVDTRGVVEFSGDPALDGPFRDHVDLLRKLARSKKVEQVFVRHAFRYWLGRNETPADAKTLQDAHAAYAAGGGSFKALVRALVTSDSFLLRRGDATTSP